MVEGTRNVLCGGGLGRAAFLVTGACFAARDGVLVMPKKLPGQVCHGLSLAMEWSLGDKVGQSFPNTETTRAALTWGVLALMNWVGCIFPVGVAHICKVFFFFFLLSLLQTLLHLPFRDRMVREAQRGCQVGRAFLSRSTQDVPCFSQRFLVIG